MSDKYDFDVAVIGGGPAGYVAGIRAAQRGARACVIEKANLGGTCTNVGCIPTKALWQAARLMREVERIHEFGINLPDVELDYAATCEHRDKVVKTLRGGVQGLLKGNGVELLQATASFRDAHTLHLAGDDLETQLTAGTIIIATGSAPIELPSAPFDHDRIIDSADAVLAKTLPESIVIVGGGYIGIEFAGIYASMGVQVTVVEALDRLLPGLDGDCAKEVAKTLKKSGVKSYTGTRMESVSTDGDDVTVKLSNGEELSAQQMLVCVGRRADCTGLEIQKAGLETGEKGQIPVNEHMQTAQAHIYAAGDCNGDPLLAHVASQEAVVAADHATGMLTAAMDYRVIPACVFAVPEVATVGMTEEQAKESGAEVTVKKFPFRALGRAYITNETDGFVKMIADASSGELLGVHICGAEASSLLGEAALALKLECTAEELAETIHAHPTLPESIREAADGVVGLPINWRG